MIGMTQPHDRGALKARIFELEGEVEQVKSEAAHLRSRFQGAVEDAAKAQASVEGLERTVRLLRSHGGGDADIKAKHAMVISQLESTRLVYTLPGFMSHFRVFSQERT